jgi:hypothetical protein
MVTDKEMLDWIETECRKHGLVSFDRHATAMFSVSTQHISSTSLRALMEKAMSISPHPTVESPTN